MKDHKDDCAIVHTGHCTCDAPELNPLEVDRRRLQIEARLRNQKMRLEWLNKEHRLERGKRLDLEHELLTERRARRRETNTLRWWNLLLALWAVTATAWLLLEWWT